MRNIRKRMKIKKGLKKNPRRIRERCWKKSCYWLPVRILFFSINEILFLSITV